MYKGSSKLAVYLLGAIAMLLSACGGTTKEPEPYSVLCTNATDPVTIADAALLASVRAAVGKPTGSITCEDMEQITSLTNQGAGIESLSGLQYATNLEHLNLAENNISDLGPLANLSKLQHLNVNVNPIQSFEPLRKLTNLLDLHVCCNTNDISDISPLEGLTKLRAINLNGYRLGDDVLWPLLAKFPNLTGLWIGRNDLTDLSPLANYQNALQVELNETNVPDLSIFAGFNQLYWLELSYAVVGDLTPIHGMTQLEVLNLSGIGLKYIDFLAGFNNLNRLQISDNSIRDLGPLVANAGLGSGDNLDLRWNPLDRTDSSVVADLSALEARGVNIRQNPGEQTRYDHVEPAVEATLATLVGNFADGGLLYGAVTGPYSFNTPAPGRSAFTFSEPFIPFQVEADETFEVPLTTPSSTRTDTAGSCDFGGTAYSFLGPFFDEPVTLSMEVDNDSLTFLWYEADTLAHALDFWYSTEDRTIECQDRATVLVGGLWYIRDYDLQLKEGWNTVLRFRSIMANGQTYDSYRSGTMADSDGVLQLSQRQP